MWFVLSRTNSKSIMTSIVTNTAKERSIKIFNNPAWHTRQIYIVMKTTTQVIQNPIEKQHEVDKQQSRINSLDEDEDYPMSTSKSSEITPDSIQDFIILNKVYIVHQFLCIESPIWMKMFDSDTQSGGGVWKESQSNEIVHMYVEDELEGKMLYSLFETVHTSTLPELNNMTEKGFIKFVMLADKYELAGIIEIILDKMRNNNTEHGEFIALHATIIEHFNNSYSPLFRKMVFASINICLGIVSKPITKVLSDPKDRQRMVEILVMLFSPLDMDVLDERLMKLEISYFIDVMKDDGLRATNESMILWCCLHYIEVNNVCTIDLENILTCVHFELLSPIAQVYFATEFSCNTSPISISIVTKCVQALARDILIYNSLPNWRKEKVRIINSQKKIRAPLTEQELVSLYTMDFTFKIPQESMNVSDDDTKSITIKSQELYYRGGWKWILSIERRSKKVEERGTTGIFVRITPINDSVTSTTTIQASGEILVETIENGWQSVSNILNGEIDYEGNGDIIRDKTRDKYLKWNNLVNSGVMDKDNTIRARLVVDPTNLSC